MFYLANNVCHCNLYTDQCEKKEAVMFCHYLHCGSGIAVGYHTTNHTEVQEDSELNFKLTIATRNSPGITEPHNWSEVRLSLPLFVHWSLIVYGLNATDKLPVNDWNATEVLLSVGVLGLGSIFCVEVLGDGILALAFCPEIQRCRFMSNIEQF